MYIVGICRVTHRCEEANLVRHPRTVSSEFHDIRMYRCCVARAKKQLIFQATLSDERSKLKLVIIHNIPRSPRYRLGSGFASRLTPALESRLKKGGRTDILVWFKRVTCQKKEKSDLHLNFFEFWTRVSPPPPPPRRTHGARGSETFYFWAKKKGVKRNNKDDLNSSPSERTIKQNKKRILWYDVFATNAHHRIESAKPSSRNE